jgi:hypothetical protein
MVVALVNAASFAITTCKLAVAQKQVAAAVSAALSEIPICKQPVAPAHNNVVALHPVAPRDNVDLFRILIDKLTVGPRQVAAKASVGLSETMTYRQCVELKRAAAAASAALSATPICKPLAVPKQDNQYSFNSETKNETTQKTYTYFDRACAGNVYTPRLDRAVK